MQARLPSGVPGLDGILQGGLPENAINLIVGLPGTGKTLLAQQYVFTNASPEHPVVYLSTVSEPFEKIIRYGQTLSFFDPDAVGQCVFYEDLGAELLAGGTPAVLERVEDIVRSREPRLLVIDSFKPLAALTESRSEYRRLLHELAARLSIHPVTSLWLGEYSMDEMGRAPEFAIADAVIWLTSGRYEQREFRLLQVLKLRGSGFVSGKHAYRLSADGMNVFPRLADPAEQSEYSYEERWRGSGVRGLDRVLGEGYRAGSSTLVIGPSGIGKTVLGMHFVCEGARSGERTVFATFDENPSQIALTAAGFGWLLEAPGVQLLYRSAVDLHLDQWVYELLKLVEPEDTGRVFIDGLGNLRAAAHDPMRFQEYLYSLVQRFARRGVTLMMSLESAELFGITRVADVPLSQVADNLIVLQFVRLDGEYRRALTVLKSRAARTDPRMYQYDIGSAGIELRDQEPSSPRP